MLAIKEALEQKSLRRDFSIAELMAALTPKSSATIITARSKASDFIERNVGMALPKCGFLKATRSR
jgi:hypothetical protein